jgi:hypothetical protein
MHRVRLGFLASFVDVFEPMRSVDLLGTMTFQSFQQLRGSALNSSGALETAHFGIEPNVFNDLLKRRGSRQLTGALLVNFERKQAFRLAPLLESGALIAPLLADAVFDLPKARARALKD